MQVVDVKIEKMFDDVVIPEYKHAGDSGMDVRAYLTKKFVDETPGIKVFGNIKNGDINVVINPGDTLIIPTGLKTEIPQGYEIQVRSRSGLAAKNGIHVLNSPGTVDSGYRGEYKIILHNASKEKFTVSNGDRIAQIILVPVCMIRWNKVNNVEESERSEGGFGSTGTA